MGRYEVQVLDSWKNATYPDGMAGAIYGQKPPRINAARPPGEWQTYDITFMAPEFDDDGKVVKPATMTVLWNGVPVQDTVAAEALLSTEGPWLTLDIQRGTRRNTLRYRL